MNAASFAVIGWPSDHFPSLILNVQVRLSAEVVQLSAMPGSGLEFAALFTVRYSYISRPTWVEIRSTAVNGFSVSISWVCETRIVVPLS